MVPNIIVRYSDGRGVVILDTPSSLHCPIWQGLLRTTLTLVFDAQMGQYLVRYDLVEAFEYCLIL